MGGAPGGASSSQAEAVEHLLSQLGFSGNVRTDLEWWEKGRMLRCAPCSTEHTFLAGRGQAAGATGELLWAVRRGLICWACQ